MEKIKNIIENKIDDSRHFESARQELLDYQFQYIEKIDRGDITTPEEDTDFDETNDYYKFRKNFKEKLTNSFSKYLFDYTTLDNQLVEEYYKRVGKKDFNEEICNNWLQNIFNEIGIIYDSQDMEWRENVFSFIKEKINEIGPEKKDYNDEDEEKEKKEKNLGLIHFNVTKEKKLSEYGLRPKDACLDVHLSDLYKQKEENSEIVNIFSGNSWSQLACDIVDKHPDIKAVIGRSWLIDSPLGQRIGFTKYGENKSLRNGSFWGQFIDENGKIKKEKIDKFLRTGQPDYFVSMGFIKVKDFLGKYLPDGRKGPVKLKDRTRESIIFENEKEKTIKEIEKRFNELSYEKINKLIMNSVFSDFFKTSLGVEFLSFLEIAKSKNLKSFDEIKSERYLELKKEFRKFIEEKENQYVEKVITIE